MIEKLQNNEQIKKLQNLVGGHGNFLLVGGAVIDILEDRTPKDYDFLPTFNKEWLVESAGWKFLYSSSMADTYSFDGIICQILKKPLEDFEYTISQSKVYIKKDTIYDLNVDTVSFNSKTLIPVGWERKHVRDCLIRIPHYKKKGYSIPDETYLSLVRAHTKSHKTIES